MGLSTLRKAVWRERTSGSSLSPEHTTNATPMEPSEGEEAPVLDPDLSGSLSVSELVDETYLDFPEGGLRAYLTVFGSFMGFIPAFGMFNSVGAIQSYVSANQLKDVSTSTVSWIFSIYTFVAYSSCIFSGTFFDRCGAFKPMLIGTVAFCAGLVATANATTVYQFILAFGVVVGFGTGMLISPLVGAVSHFFYKKRATATSIATMGGSLGGISMPMLLRKTYDTIGFAWGLRVLALYCLGCLICSLCFTRERQLIMAEERNVKIESWRQFFQVYFVDVFDHKSLFELRFVSCALGIALAECSLVAVMVYLPTYAIMQGQSETTAFLLIITSNAVAILGRYLPGVFADHIGRFNVVILTVFMCGVVSLALWLPFGSHLGALYAFSVLYGFFSGSILSLSPVCCGQISKTEEFGKRYSTMYLIVALTNLGLLPVAGAIIGEGTVQEYNNFIGYTVALLAAGIACYTMCRNAVVGWRLCKF